MRILADVHISPRTVEFLRSLGHDTVRVSDALTPKAADEEIVLEPEQDRRIILTQDLDFSDIVALSGRADRGRRLTDSHTQVAAAVTSTSWPLDTAMPLIEVCLHCRFLNSSRADFLCKQLC